MHTYTAARKGRGHVKPAGQSRTDKDRRHVKPAGQSCTAN